MGKEMSTFFLYLLFSSQAKIHVERIPDLLKQFPEDLSFKADISDPKFIYQRKKKTKRGEVENPIEVVKKVLIGIKGLLDLKKEDIIKKVDISLPIRIKEDTKTI